MRADEMEEVRVRPSIETQNVPMRTDLSLAKVAHGVFLPFVRPISQPKNGIRPVQFSIIDRSTPLL
jgi:hypothetical protein